MAQALKVFISSPSDVSTERRRAALVIEKLAKEYGRFFDIVPILWETEPMLASGHFQDAIVPPAETDVVVLILWSRLGTPLPERTERHFYRGIDGRVPVTGTEWEFESALAAYRQKGVPDLLVYRKLAPPKAEYRSEADLEQLRDQWRKLELFWQRYFVDQGEFRAAFNQFNDLDSFESRLESDLRRLIERRIAALHGQSEGVTSAPWLKGSPFRGLETYNFEHAPIFFGRSDVAKSAVERLVANAEAGRAFLLILGASGAGKSSLAQAGIVPALSVRGVVSGVGAWRRAVMRPAGQPGGPFASLAAALVGEGCLPELLAGQPVDALAKHLEDAAASPGFAIVSALSTREKAAREQGDLSPYEEIRLVLVVDQLEELFTQSDIAPRQRDAFIVCLQGLMQSGRVLVLATMRSDYWHRAAETPLLVALAEGERRLDLLPPSQSEVAEMIRRPAEAAGLSFETDPRTGIRLDAALAEEAAREPGALPLTSFLLDALYAEDVVKMRRSALSYASMRALGGLKGAIATRAESALAALPDDVQACFPDVLRALVTVSRSGAEPTARLAPMSRFVDGSAERRFVDALLAPQMRLLVAEGDGQGARLRLAHEALITHWERARRQIAQDRDDLRTRAALEEALTEWQAAGARHKRAYLLRDLKLASALDLLRRWRGEFSDQARIFIEASRRQALLRQRLTMAAAVVFALVAVTASTLGIVAYRSQQQTERERLRAEAGQARAEQEHQRAEKNLAQALLTQSRLLADLVGQQVKDGDGGTAVLLGLDALPDRHGGAERPYAPEAEAALFGALQGLFETTLLAGHGAAVGKAAFSPDGRRVVTASADKTARIWDAASGAQIGVLRGHDDVLLGAAFSPDGRRVVTASFDKTARIWDAESHEQIGVLKGHEAGIWNAAFSPDGTRVVTASTDRTARIWDAKSYVQIAVLAGHEAPVRTAAFSPDGKLVATGSDDKTARIWEVDTRRQIAVLKEHDSLVLGIAFSADGRLLATASGDRERPVLVWDVDKLRDGDTNARVAELKGHDLPVNSAAFGPDSRTLVTASYDRTVRIWDVRSAAPIAVLRGHEDIVWSAVFSADGRRIITASQDWTARIWDAEMQGQIALEPFDYVAWRAAFSPDGTRIVTASLDRTARIWDAETRREIAVLEGHDAAVLSAMFSPDGRRVVTASEDKTARIWDAGTRAQLAVLKGHDDKVVSAVFSPDGRRVVTASEDKTARIWDAATSAEIAVFREHGDRLTSAAFSPDGRSVVTGSYDNTTRIWDAQTAMPIALLKGGRGGALSVAFSPDGQRVVTASWDATAMVWDVAKQAPIGAFRQHGGPIFSAAFSPDGRRVITASYDKTARIWDAETYAQVALLKDEESFIESAAFRADGRRVLTSSKDVRLWRVFPATQDLVDYAKAAVPRCLGDVPRKQFGLDADAPDWCYQMAKWPYDRVRFGVIVETLSDQTRARLKLEQTEGALVTRVIKGLPGAIAGLAADDLIIAEDGQPIRDHKGFLAASAAVPSGRQTELVVIRGGETKKLIMTPRF